MLRRQPLDRIATDANKLRNVHDRELYCSRYTVKETALQQLVIDLQAKDFSYENSVVLIEALQGQFSRLQSHLNDPETALLQRLQELRYTDMIEKFNAGRYVHLRGAVLSPPQLHRQVVQNETNVTERAVKLT